MSRGKRKFCLCSFVLLFADLNARAAVLLKAQESGLISEILNRGIRDLIQCSRRPLSKAYFR